MISELFEITFVDDTKLWATMDNNEICFGTLGKGANLKIKECLAKEPKNLICHRAWIFATNCPQLVKEYRDIAEEKSAELQKQLIKAC